jgi:hypothetical protein
VVRVMGLWPYHRHGLQLLVFIAMDLVCSSIVISGQKGL